MKAVPLPSKSAHSVTENLFKVMIIIKSKYSYYYYSIFI